MSRKIFYMLFMALIVILSLVTETAQATAYYVNCNGGDDDNNGLSWPTAFATIQKGLDSASSGDTIDVNECTYYENIDFNGISCVLRSKNPNNESVVKSTIIDANGSGNVITFDSNEDANSILKGFTLRNGSSYGVYCSGTSPIISNCIIEDIDAVGINCNGGATPTIRYNKIRNNGTIGIAYGGTSTAPTITNNWSYNNTYGINSVTAGSAVIRNNTIVGNSNYGICILGTAPTITSCIIWDNNDDLYGCTATYSCIQDGDDCGSYGNICSDPCFADADANDFHLKDYTSPCIDAGDPNFTDSTEVDIDNRSRLTDGDGDATSIVDMGADEIPEMCQTCKGDLSGNGSVTTDDLYILIGMLTVNDNQPIELSNPLYKDCGDYEDDTSNPTITANDVFLLIGDLTVDPNDWD